MTTIATEPSLDLPLSTLLRTSTRQEHEEAESMAFVEALMGGRLTVAAYADLAAQHHVIYSALEQAAEAIRLHPEFSTVVFPELTRVPSIEADLAALVGADWRSRIRVLPATEAYAARLREVAGTVTGYVPHAYTRYLGDLSGGLAIKAILQRSYGVADECVNFYTFPTIPKPKLFKDRYRATLDALPLTTEQCAQIAAEARLAFQLNTAVFRELGAIHLS